MPGSSAKTKVARGKAKAKGVRQSKLLQPSREPRVPLEIAGHDRPHPALVNIRRKMYTSLRTTNSDFADLQVGHVYGHRDSVTTLRSGIEPPILALEGLIECVDGYTFVHEAGAEIDLSKNDLTQQLFPNYK